MGDERAEHRDVSSQGRGMVLNRGYRGWLGTWGEQPVMGPHPAESRLWDLLYDGEGIKQDENKWDSCLCAGGTVPVGAEQGFIYGVGRWGLSAELQPLPINPQEGKCFPAPVTTSDSNGILLS